MDNKVNPTPSVAAYIWMVKINKNLGSMVRTISLQI